MKNFSPVLQKKKRNKSTFNRTNYKLVLQLYYINKPGMKEQPKLPVNDFRRQVLTEKPAEPIKVSFRSVSKAFSKIAALW